MKITGFTGAREVQDRLAEIKRQFSEYIKNQKILIGQSQPEEQKVGDFVQDADGIYRLK